MRYLPLIFVVSAFVPVRGNLMAQPPKASPEKKSSTPFVTALWFAHAQALPAKITAGNDRELKTTLFSSLSKDATAFDWVEMKTLFDQEGFRKLAEGRSKISISKMEEMLHDKYSFRENMAPKLREHCDLLSTQFDMIEPRHFEGIDKLKSWIIKNYRPEKQLDVIVVCTGNSRRSVLGATMGNIAASYYGMNNIRFHSGGTEPTAVNPRTIKTLGEIGVEIENSGREAERGKAGDANPVYLVRWGKDLAAEEFSKKYHDDRNPKKGFAAIMVCNEADDACPAIKGADLRVSLPFLDPKLFDGAKFEAAKYGERRDDIGRVMLNIMMQSSRQLKN